MKKTIAIILSIMLLSLAMMSSVAALGEETTAKKGTPVIDGVIDEIWSKADRQELTHVKAGDLKGVDPEVEKAYASALWDENYLYFLFEVTDDDVTNAFGGDPTAQEWKNDTIFLYIDENYEAPPASPWETPGCYQFSFCFDGTSKTPRNGAAYTKETICAAVKTDTGFIIEVAFAPEIITLKGGLEIGADFQYNDGTEAGTRDYCLGWSDETDGASGNASIWGLLTLSDESVGGAAVVEEVPAAAEVETPVEKGGAEETPVVDTVAPATTPVATTTVTKAAQTGDTLTAVLSVLALIGACGVVVSRKNRA